MGEVGVKILAVLNRLSQGRARGVFDAYRESLTYQRLFCCPSPVVNPIKIYRAFCYGSGKAHGRYRPPCNNPQPPQRPTVCGHLTPAPRAMTARRNSMTTAQRSRFQLSHRPKDLSRIGPPILLRDRLCDSFIQEQHAGLVKLRWDLFGAVDRS